VVGFGGGSGASGSCAARRCQRFMEASRAPSWKTLAPASGGTCERCHGLFGSSPTGILEA
jgi:hypothetical protein